MRLNFNPHKSFANTIKTIKYAPQMYPVKETQCIRKGRLRRSGKKPIIGPIVLHLQGSKKNSLSKKHLTILPHRTWHEKGNRSSMEFNVIVRKSTVCSISRDLLFIWLRTENKKLKKKFWITVKKNFRGYCSWKLCSFALFMSGKQRRQPKKKNRRNAYVQTRSNRNNCQ